MKREGFHPTYSMTMNPLSFRIPASSGNLGAGFDCFGLAFSLYNDFHIEWQQDYRIRYSNSGSKELLDKDKNQTILSYRQACRHLGKQEIPFSLRCDNRIPCASGLGSSATAALAGYASALLRDDEKLDQSSLLQLVCEQEGHPDNVAASLYGGFVISHYAAGGGSWARSFPVASDLRCWILMPELQTYTATARTKIPERIPQQDVVFNLSHAALTAAAFIKQDYTLFKKAIKDRIHESLRDFPELNYAALKEALLATDVFSVSLSGSGPAILVLAAEIGAEQQKLVQEHFSRLGILWRDFMLKADNQGMKVVREEPLQRANIA